MSYACKAKPKSGCYSDSQAPARSLHCTKHDNFQTVFPLDSNAGNLAIDLFKPAIAIKELLDRSKRSTVQLFGALQQPEVPAKLAVEGISVIADNVETAAPCGTLWSKCTYDHVAAGIHRLRDLTNISSAVARSCQKMKYGAAVPHVKFGKLKLDRCDIGSQPVDAVGFLPQSLPTLINR